MPLAPQRLMPVLWCALVLSAAGCAGNGQATPPTGAGPQTLSDTVTSSASPSPAPSTTPVGSPTPTPTATPVPTPTPFTNYPGYIHLIQGGVIGAPKMFTPTRGDAWPGTAQGTAGQPIDGITCKQTMTENQYHVHAFVGVLVNGRQYATPDSIGMNGWGPLINVFVNAAKCFYDIHTHDATGMIHIEAAQTLPYSATLYTLGNLLDIWDQPLTSTGFAQFSGMTRIFYVPRPPVNTQYVYGWTEYTGDPYQIPIYTHTAIWIEVGPPWVEAAQLPKIRYYTEY